MEGYNIVIRNVRKTMWMEVGQVSADCQSFNIKDLAEDEEYLIRIIAHNEVGNSDPLESDEPYRAQLGAGEFLLAVCFTLLYFGRYFCELGSERE